MIFLRRRFLGKMKQGITAKVNKWKLFTGLFALLFIISLFGTIFSITDITSRSISQIEAESKVGDVLTNYINDPRLDIKVNDIQEDHGLYLVNISVNFQNETEHATTYLTKDGELFFFQGINLNEVTQS